MRTSRFVLLAWLILGAGCAPTADREGESSVDLEAERADLLARDRAFSEAPRTAEKPLEAVLAVMTDDVLLLAPDVPLVEGKEASRDLWTAISSLPGYSLEFTPTRAEIGGAADLGYTIGTYRMTLSDSTGRLMATEGKYLTIWRRQDDGSWKMEADMFNADGPPVQVNQ